METVSPWAFGWTQLLTIIGMAITLFIAIGGFRTFDRWKREKLEERKMEVAFDMLAVAYEAKFVFDHIRRPTSFSYEWADMPEDISETEDQRKSRGEFYAILKRINLNKDYFERVWKLQPRCMAMFGASVEEIFLLLHRARREVEVAAQMFASKMHLSDDMRAKLEHDVWEMGEPAADRVGKKLADFRTRTEGLCKPIIDRDLRGVRRRLRARKASV